MTHISSSVSPGKSQFTWSDPLPPIQINLPKSRVAEWMEKAKQYFKRSPKARKTLNQSLALPRDVIFHISTFLSPEEVACASVTCKIWRKIDNKVVWKKQYELQGYAPLHPAIAECLRDSSGFSFLPSILKIIAEYEGNPREIDYKAEFAKPVANAFGATAWNKYHGDGKKAAVAYLPRPADMRLLNNQPCCFWPWRKKGETHCWTLKPKEINGKPLSPGEHERLVKGYKAKFHLFSQDIIGHKERPSDRAQWLYMTIRVVPHSRNMNGRNQSQMVKKHGYRLPTGFEAIHVLFAHYVTGKYLLNDVPYTVTRTSTLAFKKWEWTVGWGARAGLNVNTAHLYCRFSHDIGAAAIISRLA